MSFSKGNQVWSVHIDPVFSHFGVEGCAADSELAAHPGYVPVVMAHAFCDRTFFEIFKRNLACFTCIVGLFRLLSVIVLIVSEPRLVFNFQDVKTAHAVKVYQVLHEILQLTYVSRPMVAKDLLLQFFAYIGYRFVQLPCFGFHKVVEEGFHILLSLSQRGDE